MTNSSMDDHSTAPQKKQGIYIAIIGSAGRGDDAELVTRETYFKIVNDAAQQIKQLAEGKQIHLVSGGAAFVDHSAVSLYLKDLADSLTLYFPCKWNPTIPNFIGRDILDETGHVNYNSSVASSANYYHRKFSEKVGRNTLLSIQKAIDKGAKYHEIEGGFKARNLLVGKDCDVLLAYGFAKGKAPSSPGTRHTWSNSNSKIKIYRCIGEL